MKLPLYHLLSTIYLHSWEGPEDDMVDLHVWNIEAGLSEVMLVTLPQYLEWQHLGILSSQHNQSITELYDNYRRKITLFNTMKARIAQRMKEPLGPRMVVAQEGELVEVVKGRKAPRGLYRVQTTRHGQYGLAYTLVTLDNQREFHWISHSNLAQTQNGKHLLLPRLAQEYHPLLEECPFLNEEAGQRWAAINRGHRTPLLVLADLMEDHGDCLADLLRRVANHFLCGEQQLAD